MLIRDTILLPSLRYIMTLFDRFPTEKVVGELDKLCVYTNKETGITALLESIRDWSKEFNDRPEAAKISLEKMIHDPQECGQCDVCLQCWQYFLVRLYQSHYDDGRFDALEQKIKGGDHFVLEELPESISKHITSKSSVSEYYWERCQDLKKTERSKDTLTILKGMSSSTPAILNAAFDTQTYHGGGLYLNWKGSGIVIDPGYHFIENMHREGLDILDIHAVVVTHEHIDHTNDIRLLDDLNASIQRYAARQDPKREKIKWYLDSVTYELAKTLQDGKSGFLPEANELYKILPARDAIAWEEEKDDKEISIGEGIPLDKEKNIIMQIVRTLHEKKDDAAGSTGAEKYREHTYAVSFVLKADKKDRKVFYTSDTRFEETLARHAQGSDIVIANISSIYEDDILRIKRKETHLGYMGCYDLLMSMKEQPPSIFLVSEFWNGKTDIRFDVLRFLKKEMEEHHPFFEKTKIIPAEIGMQIDLTGLKMRCSICKTFADDLIMIRPTYAYDKIDHICRQCYY